MALTPMMIQYLETKEKYKDCILFYRLGDFYEMFFDDALEASKVLDLTLTGRDCGLKERAPMCGIPYHSAENYIAKLIENNYKVAICEQLTQPDGKSLVVRDVVKVITPGTVMEENLIKEDKNNFIASVYLNESSAGIAWSDITTGDFFITEKNAGESLEKLIDFLLSLQPAEIICNEAMYKYSKDLKATKIGLLPNFSSFFDWAFDFDTAYKITTRQLNVVNLKAFECETKKLAISAGGALLEYFSQTQKRSLSHINRLSFITDNKYMVLDNSTRRNLELTKTMRDGKKQGSLLWLLGNTSTSMGARNTYSWIEQPLRGIDEINLRLDSVAELVENDEAREVLIESLSGIRDIERLSAKIGYGNINPRDCISIRNTFCKLPVIKSILNKLTSQKLKNINSGIFLFEETLNLLSDAINDNPPIVLKDGNIIKEGFSEELDNIKSASIDGKKWMSQLETYERENTGIKSLKVGFNRIFGYYIEISKSYISEVPINYIRKQTLAGGERYITEELKRMEEKILGAEERAINLEIKLFNEIVSKLFNLIRELQVTAKSLAEIDSLVTFADVAIKNKYIRPNITDSNNPLKIVNGRHPIVEVLTKGGEFVANDTYLDSIDDRIMIITGPNMAGKSTYMRQVALITLMAHIGSFVPAQEAIIPLTDRIFTRVGAMDNLAFDQSTFMVEMSEVASILNNATSKSLLILDEVGRGTGTFDGLSIAWAVTEYIAEKIKAKTLFATHYHELSELEGSLNGVKNYSILIKELAGNIVFLRKIIRGSAGKSFGIEVAALAGLPKQVLLRSKKILKQLEEADINNSKNKAAQISFDNVKITVDTKAEDIKNFIDEIDINNISPIEAINMLNSLKKMIK